MSRYSSEMTPSDWVEMLSHFRPEPTGHVVHSWDAPNVLVLSGDDTWHVGDEFWLKGLNSANPFTGADTGVELRVIVSRVLSKVTQGDKTLTAIQTHPNLMLTGPYRNVATEPQPNQAVWSMVRKPDKP